MKQQRVHGLIIDITVHPHDVLSKERFFFGGSQRVRDSVVYVCFSSFAVRGFPFLNSSAIVPTVTSARNVRLQTKTS